MKLHMKFFGEELGVDYVRYIRALLLKDVVSTSFHVANAVKIIADEFLECRERSYRLLGVFETGKYVKLSEDKDSQEVANGDIEICNQILSEEDRLHIWGLIDSHAREFTTPMFILDYLTQPTGQITAYRAKLMEVLGDRTHPREENVEYLP